MGRGRWGVVAVVVLAVVLGACGVALARGAWSYGDGLRARVVESPVVKRAEQAARSLNRIVVVGEDGNLSLVSPDGSNRRALTDDASAGHTYRYPTWSPDAQRIAFVELALGETMSDATSALHVVSPDGEALQRVPTEFPPFYLFWSPTNDALAFLSSWPGGLALRLVDVAGGATQAKTISEGSPFYFSWEPLGERLLAHIGLTELAFLDRAGNQQSLELPAGLFQAPHWRADGQRLAFVQEDDDASVLSVSDPQGENVQVVEQQDAVFAFNWSPDNRRLAYTYTDRAVGLAAYGPLWVRDVATGEAWELSRAPVVAFFWSPDGQRLAFLRPEPHERVRPAPRAAPLRQGAQLWLRWHLWDGERTYPLALFSPSESFLLDYLRYFDQYAQSISLWSPDSGALLYAGLAESGLSGVWTLPIAEGSSAQRLAPGVLAAWSPR